MGVPAKAQPSLSECRHTMVQWQRQHVSIVSSNTQKEEEEAEEEEKKTEDNSVS